MTCVYVCVCECVMVSKCLYACVCVHEFVCACMFVCLHALAHMHSCAHVCVCVCMFSKKKKIPQITLPCSSQHDCTDLALTNISERRFEVPHASPAREGNASVLLKAGGEQLGCIFHQRYQNPALLIYCAEMQTDLDAFGNRVCAGAFARRLISFSG